MPGFSVRNNTQTCRQGETRSLACTRRSSIPAIYDRSDGTVAALPRAAVVGRSSRDNYDNTDARARTAINYSTPRARCEETSPFAPLAAACGFYDAFPREIDGPPSAREGERFGNDRRALVIREGSRSNAAGLAAGGPPSERPANSVERAEGLESLVDVGAGSCPLPDRLPSAMRSAGPAEGRT